MPHTPRQLKILKTIDSLGEATRMEVFHSFDGVISWHNIKIRMTRLCAEKLIECHPGLTPEKPKLWALTGKGKEAAGCLPLEDTTETVER